MKITREHEIRMPQMANNALSEYWLVKELGDIHWTLLSHGLDQKSSEFKDCLGNRLYASFVRINYSLSPLTGFQENQILSLNGEIKKLKSNTYYSNIQGTCKENRLKADLLTSFTVRERNDNSKISKAILTETVNRIKYLNNAPVFLNQHRLLKKNLLTKFHSNNYAFNVTDSTITTIRYTVNPFYEINGVGLLYFACYPIIADKCTADYFKQAHSFKNYETNYLTVYRDVFYFANCNANDTILFNLNSIENIDDNKLTITSSLYRQRDNVLMARLFTVQQKQNNNQMKLLCHPATCIAQ